MKRIWSLPRQLAGNFIPLALAFPFFFSGIVLLNRGDVGFAWLACGLSAWVGIVAVNRLGYFQNSTMKREFNWRHQRELQVLQGTRYFAGVATSHYVSLLDPHEDIGFLYFDPAGIRFFGEEIRILIPFERVTSVKRAFNPHTLFLLGGFVEVQFLNEDGKPNLLKIELREEKTVSRNKKALNRLLSDGAFRAYSQKESAAPPPEGDDTA